MRIIEADALKDRLQEALDFQEKHDNYEGAELFVIAQDIVDEQPTVDAIPVEWMREKMQKPQMTCANPFGYVLAEWLEEQEAR